MRQSNGFVEDGYNRACSALEPQIRAEVSAEYEERLKCSGFWERRRIEREIEREITRRVHEKAPPDALY